MKRDVRQAPVRPCAVLLLALAAGAGSIAANETVEVEFVLDVRGQDPGALPGELTVYAVDPATRESGASHAVSPISQGQRLVLALPVQQAGWLVWARAPGWWGPARYLATDRRTASLVLAPEGVVRFAVDGVDRAVDGLGAGQVWMVGRVDGGGEGLARGVYGGPCAVDREQDRREVLIACPFARGEQVDLRVTLGPFLPLLRSDVTIAADTDLGLIEPVRGAAVAGSLASADGSSQFLGLRQPGAPLAFPWSAWTESDGAFAFEGLSPGAYELRLVGSDGDAWPVRIESLSDRIDLGQLSSAAGNVLAVSFGVPFGIESDRLRPVVRAVELGDGEEPESRGRRHEPDARREDDSFIWRGLPVGDYEVDIGDDRGNRWHREVFRFHGQDQHYLQLDAISLAGRIERGGEPLEDVMIWFGGLWGAARVSFRSGEEGRFNGLLPREGFWPVEVTPSPACDPCEGGWDTDGWQGFDGREVDDAGLVEIVADADGAARILIDLPVGSASGRVWWRKAETGLVEPVEGASIQVSSGPPAAGETVDVLLPRHWQRTTDATGRFEITGLPEGVYRIQAGARLREREYRSRTEQFRVTGRDAIDSLDLRLEHQQRLTVAVRSSGVPVTGAQTFVHDLATGQHDRSNGRTDGSGDAFHWLSEGSSLVDVVVRADGLGLVGWRFDTQDGQPIVIEMLPDRGLLRVPNVWQAALVTPGGVSMPVGILAGINDYGQVQTDGEEFVIRDLAPGTYRWCSSPDVCIAAEVAPWAESRIGN